MKRPYTRYTHRQGRRNRLGLQTLPANAGLPSRRCATAQDFYARECARALRNQRESERRDDRPRPRFAGVEVKAGVARSQQCEGTPALLGARPARLTAAGRECADIEPLTRQPPRPTAPRRLNNKPTSGCGRPNGDANPASSLRILNDRVTRSSDRVSWAATRGSSSSQFGVAESGFG